MRTDHIARSNHAPIFLTKKGDVSGWVPKPPGPKRSVLSQVHQAISRLIEQVKAEPSRLHRVNQTLAAANERLRAQLKFGPPDSDQEVLPDLDTPHVPELKSRRAEYVRLVEQRNELQVHNFVLSQMVVAHAKLESILVALSNPGSDPNAIQSEANEFSTLLYELNGARSHDTHKVAGVYSDRLHAHLSRMDSGELTKLMTGARVYLNGKHGDVTDRAVVQNILFCARAQRLWITEGKKNMQTFNDAQLTSMSKSSDPSVRPSHLYVRECDGTASDCGHKLQVGRRPAGRVDSQRGAKRVKRGHFGT